MTVTVIVPTFRRPDDLRRCLEHLTTQSRRPDQTIVVVRDIDTASSDAYDAFDGSSIGMQRVVVDEPGHVAALNAALAHATGDVVAITDDDAAPHEDWLRRIETHLDERPGLGGVGGPDWLDGGDVNGAADVCGSLQWFGRISTDKPGVTDVDILKGCNMSYRGAAVGDTRFDTRLLGTGAQVFNDFAFSLAIRRKGWELVYDPAVAVDHYQAPKADEDVRDTFVAAAHANATHNRTLLILDHLRPLNRVAYLAYAGLVGSRPWPGLATTARACLHRESNAIPLWRATVKGHVMGVRTFARSRRARRSG